jgi:hypothetical protein
MTGKHDVSSLIQNQEWLEWLNQLTQFDQLFQTPKSDAKSMQDIANDINPDIEVKASRDGRNWTIIMEDGSRAFVKTDTDDKIYVDASNLEAGKSRGSELYSIIGTYAHNNGVVFKGDPDGLSKMAMIRRTEQMLSSALKYGTTRHLEPHELQDIEWSDIDEAGNMKRLIEKSYRNTVDGFWEAGYAAIAEIDHIQFNFATGDYEWISSGQKVTDDDFYTISDRLRTLQARYAIDDPAGGERPSTPGRATLKRAALLASLLRAHGRRGEGARRGGGGNAVLAEPARFGCLGGLAGPPAELVGICYSDPFTDTPITPNIREMQHAEGVRYCDLTPFMILTGTAILACWMSLMNGGAW